MHVTATRGRMDSRVGEVGIGQEGSEAGGRPVGCLRELREGSLGRASRNRMGKGVQEEEDGGRYME